MARTKRAPRKVAEQKCAICSDTMKLRRVIPAAHIFAELKTFQCVGCGNLRTVEHEAELAVPEIAQVAA